MVARVYFAMGLGKFSLRPAGARGKQNLDELPPPRSLLYASPQNSTALFLQPIQQIIVFSEAEMEMVVIQKKMRK